METLVDTPDFGGQFALTVQSMAMMYIDECLKYAAFSQFNDYWGAIPF